MLGEVAALAQREEAWRSFLDEGFDIRTLYGPCGHAGPARVGDGGGPGRPAERPGDVGPALPPQPVVELEIGDELYVSLNTVKSHLKTIYRKLEVDRRDEAVRRARQLGLL